LLASEDVAVKRTAFNVLADIANGVAAKDLEIPSETESDRAQVAKQLLTLLAPQQSVDVKQQALRLIPIVILDSDDFGPITALLADPAMREKARAALEQIGSPAACRELLKAAMNSQSEPDFAVALIRATGSLRQASSAMPLLAMTTDANPSVRAAAAQALAWMGHPDLYPFLRTVAQTADPQTQAEAFDAVYRLAEAMVRNGGNYDFAMRIYSEQLQVAPTSPLKSAALMGLGANGDASVVPTIVAATNGADATLLDAAVMALGSVQGREAVRAVKAAFPSLPPTAQTGLVAIWGQRKEKEAVDLVKEGLKSSDPRMRSTALYALANMGSLDAFPALMEVAQSGPEEEKAFALKTAISIANSLDKLSNPAEAGKAYLTLFAMAPNDDVRNTALKGISEAPLPEAFDIVKAALQQPALKDMGALALAGVAGALSTSGDAVKTKEAMDLVRTVQVAPELLAELARKLQSAGVSADLSNLLGVVKTWNLVGPFDWKGDQDWGAAFVGEPKIDLAASHEANGKQLQWKKVVTADPIGIVDLTGNVAARDRCFAYAYAVVDVPEAVDAQVRTGSDDGNKIWVNGTVVGENRVDRGTALDQDKADIHLNQGRNEILVKISQGAGGWNFCLRLCSPNGAGILFTQPE
jgi:HEAT repeat protein